LFLFLLDEDEEWVKEAIYWLERDPQMKALPEKGDEEDEE